MKQWSAVYGPLKAEKWAFYGSIFQVTDLILFQIKEIKNDR